MDFIRKEYPKESDNHNKLLAKKPLDKESRTGYKAYVEKNEQLTKILHGTFGKFSQQQKKEKSAEKTMKTLRDVFQIFNGDRDIKSVPRKYKK